MGGLRDTYGNSGSILDQLRRIEEQPDFTMGEVAGGLSGEAFRSLPGIGTVYEQTIAPELSVEQVKPGGRYAPPVYRYKTEEEVAKEGNRLISKEEYNPTYKYWNPEHDWEPGDNEARLKVLFDWHTTKVANEELANARPFTAFALNLGMGLADPIGWVPVAGPMLKVGLLGRLLFAGLEAGTINVATTLAVSPLRSKFHKDELTLDAIGQTFGMGALFGFLLRGGYEGVRKIFPSKLDTAADKPPTPADLPPGAVPPGTTGGPGPTVPPTAAPAPEAAPAPTPEPVPEAAAPPTPEEDLTTRQTKFAEEAKTATGDVKEVLEATKPGSGLTFETAQKHIEMSLKANRPDVARTIVEQYEQIASKMSTTPEGRPGTPKWQRRKNELEANRLLAQDNARKLRDMLPAEEVKPPIKFKDITEEPKPPIKFKDITETAPETTTPVAPAVTKPEGVSVLPFLMTGEASQELQGPFPELYPGLTISREEFRPKVTTDVGKVEGVPEPESPVSHWDLHTPSNVLSSRVIIRDGVNSLNNGDMPKMSAQTKSIIAQSRLENHRQMEQLRYELDNSPEIRAQQKALDDAVVAAKQDVAKLEAELAHVVAGLKKEILKEQKERGTTLVADAVKDAADKRGVEAAGHGWTKPRSLIPEKAERLIDREDNLIKRIEKSEKDLDVKASERAKLTSRRMGYVTEPPKHIEGITYNNLKSVGDLPDAIVRLLPEDVKGRVAALIEELRASILPDPIGPRRPDIVARIKKEIAPYLGSLYSGTYGRLHHGTGADFEQHSKLMRGSNVRGAPSAKKAFWFAERPVTSNDKLFTKIEDIGISPQGLAELSDFTTILQGETVESNIRDLEDLFGMTASISEMKRLTEIVKEATKNKYRLRELDPFNNKKEIKATEKEQAKLNKEFSQIAKQVGEKNLPSPNVRLQNVTFRNPYVYDFQGNPKNTKVESFQYGDLVQDAIDHGNDGVIFLNTIDIRDVDNLYGAFEPDQIDNALQLKPEPNWVEARAEVNWKTAESDLQQAAMDFSKPIPVDQKLAKEMELANVDPDKPNGVKDAELDRMDLESARANMTPEQITVFDETVKILEEQMKSEDRIAAASEAVIKCRTK